jgi:predicted nucleotidyltransferase
MKITPNTPSLTNPEFVFHANKIANYLELQMRIERAWIFGSYARGDQHELSDIDLMIEPSSEWSITLFDLAELQFQLQKITRKKIDLVMLGAPLPEIETRINHDKILIYESNISRRGRKNKTYTRSNRVH